MTRLQAIWNPFFVAVESFDDLVRVDECFWCLSVLVLAVVAVVLTMECACAESLCSHVVYGLRA